MAGIERADTVTNDGRKHIVRTHGVEGPGTHDPEQCHFVAQTASYIIRKGSTVAGRFTLKGFRPGNVIFLRADMKCFGSEGLELIANRTARFCRHMADTLEATRVRSCPRVLTTRLGPPALRWVSSPILHVQVSTLTESRGLQAKSDFWKHWPTHWACQAQGAEQEAFVDWPVGLATTHGQSRAHRGELTELGIRLRRSWGRDGKADGQMCVTIP